MRRRGRDPLAGVPLCAAILAAVQPADNRLLLFDVTGGPPKRLEPTRDPGRSLRHR